MILSSNISFVQNSSRHESAFDSSQLRIRQSGASLPGEGQQLDGRELSVVRQATYRYTSQEQLGFTSSSQVSGGDRNGTFTSAEMLEKSSEVFLMGQQALTVSRAALGGGAAGESSGSLSVSAGRYMFYSQSQSRSFASTGSITLDNGETIDFTLSLRQSQSHSYEYSESIQIRERPMTDPLVINFGTSTARLTDTLFEFDMTGNGDTAEFASLGSGSGYLVFDRNGNGTVDDGSELFGPASGSGFSELAAYDDDGNLWIDENDAVFDSLSVWVQSADGKQELKSLSEVGVKALYVDNADDRFTMTNSQGVPLGQIKGTGIYLTTDGEVRTLEELELAEQNTETVPPLESSLGQSGDDNEVGGALGARIDAIRNALAKLNELREKQQEFIEESKKLGEQKSPLDDYLSVIDRLRLELLNSQDEKKQAASRYLEFARD
ncbi:hypothetical protein C7H09_12235 [Marinobacter fuscus]|uniref:Uncharacterized protein n=1 Tax=Marinobacter fuscus TaxID=2109942 RepID=A0A2T1K7G1_9GAMM|nr:hypothetical protein [Marinobacter fuscus]PSF06099.1 hypothetical protein C7H09_12235 [Marinobacter fuscus]